MSAGPKRCDCSKTPRVTAGRPALTPADAPRSRRRPGAHVLAIGLAVALQAGALAGQEPAVRPVDEASRDPSFAAFRSDLLAAVQSRDTAHVLGILADDVVPGFGANAGVEGFRHRWFGEGLPPGESLWPVLEEVLRGGGVFRDDTTFVAPYTFALFPDTLDAYRWGVVTGTGVRVRAAPRLDARVLAHRSHTVIRVREWGAKPDAGGAELRWIPVALRDGRRGWMAADYVRSPLDHRAIFVRRNGRWLLRALVVGD